MAFNTVDFIKEMKERPCLWNVSIEGYYDKLIRQRAWYDVAENLHDDWQNVEKSTKMKRVKHLQKKWKGLRDYHFRERGKKPPLKSEDGLRRRRKTTLLNMLGFLNVIQPSIRKFKIEKNDITNTVNTTHGIQKEDSRSSSKPTEKPAFQQVLQNLMERNKEDDPDKNFLLSILPEMKSMSPTQNFNFRFEVMKIIKQINYEENVSEVNVKNENESADMDLFEESLFINDTD